MINCVGSYGTTSQLYFYFLTFGHVFIIMENTPLIVYLSLEHMLDLYGESVPLYKLFSSLFLTHHLTSNLVGLGVWIINNLLGGFDRWTMIPYQIFIFGLIQSYKTVCKMIHFSLYKTIFKHYLILTWDLSFPQNTSSHLIWEKPTCTLISTLVQKKIYKFNSTRKKVVN